MEEENKKQIKSDEETKMVVKNYGSSFSYSERLKKYFSFKLATNKLIFALALTGAVTGSISLVISSVAVNKTDGLNYYLDQGYKAIWGKGTIWKKSENSFYLYFGKKRNKNDIKWDGTYPKGYFND